MPESQWTVAGFNQRFEELIAKPYSLAYQEAYARAEEEHYKAFGRLRYSSYESFRVVRRTYIVNKLKET